MRVTKVSGDKGGDKGVGETKGETKVSDTIFVCRTRRGKGDRDIKLVSVAAARTMRASLAGLGVFVGCAGWVKGRPGLGLWRVWAGVFGVCARGWGLGYGWGGVEVVGGPGGCGGWVGSGFFLYWMIGRRPRRVPPSGQAAGLGGVWVCVRRLCARGVGPGVARREASDSGYGVCARGARGVWRAVSEGLRTFLRRVRG
jgi:hypothetical protein